MFVDHRTLIEDKVRTGAYQKAIKQVVKKGDVVVDIGTGSGILAFFACQAAAKKVYAIEVKKEVIELAREIARANGFQNRIIFIQDVSTEVTLPEKADVLISELIGNFVLAENLNHFIIDGRDRFLKQGGKLIPSDMKMFLVPVEAPAIYEDVIFSKQNLYDINFLPLRNTSINCLHSVMVNPTGFLSKPALLKEIDFYRIKNADELYLDKSLSFRVNRPGVLHGLAGWFIGRLSTGTELSTSPFSPATHWENAFFPLEKPVSLVKGDIIHIQIKTAPPQLGYEVLWVWHVEVEGKEKAAFNHSTLQSLPISRESLMKRSVDFTPELSSSGEIVRFVVNQFDGEKTIRQVAEDLHQKYPASYPDVKKALSKVAELAKKYSKDRA